MIDLKQKLYLQFFFLYVRSPNAANALLGSAIILRVKLKFNQAHLAFKSIFSHHLITQIINVKIITQKVGKEVTDDVFICLRLEFQPNYSSYNAIVSTNRINK
ncbi:MAG: hypothetical protein ACI9UD_002839 [Glaciecola sp.]|jgi:hypothetical protein